MQTPYCELFKKSVQRVGNECKKSTCKECPHAKVTK